MKSGGVISFVLDNEIKQINLDTETYLSPTSTVLNYLRSLTNHLGVKEGCAEGDCGACTIVLGELVGNRITYKAYDSCLIFLPMIHGKHLITIENIGDSKHLHPVQQAMVDDDGSQCGFCTPGIVMSLFSLYKNHKNPSRETIDDALTGNLCRCTGYQSIVNAAIHSCRNPSKDSISQSEKSVLPKLKSLSKKSININNGKQAFYRPVTLKEALEYNKKKSNSIVITGATDIALLVTKKNQLLKQIIDLSGVEELKLIKSKANEISYGAGLPLEAIKTHCKKYFPALYNCLSVFGSLQIRNLASLGGNLASASPIGDAPPILMAYDASVVLTSLKGKRKIKISEFIKGYRQTQLKPGELIKSIDIPLPKKGIKIKWYKISKRKDLDISSVSAGFRLKLSEDKKVQVIALYYGGMDKKTRAAKKTENFLLKKSWSRENIEKACELLLKEFKPISDARASSEGRMIMAKNLLIKFWVETSSK